MDEYVKKSEALDALANAMPSLTTPDGRNEIDHDIHIADEAFVDAMQVIHDLPSSDVQPVRHGYWIRHTEQKNIFNGKTIECSECGEKYVVQYIEDEKFCRSCGARMDGEQNE